tara:strand:+ start:518 stop:1096 length:579 start_codon:yes stop_codon:yes gene_type:complete
MIVIFDKYKDKCYTPYIKEKLCNKSMEIHENDLSWMGYINVIEGVSTYDEVMEDFDEDMQYLIYCDVRNSDYVFGKKSTIFNYLTTEQKRFLNRKNVGILFCEIQEGWKEEYLEWIYNFCKLTKTPTHKIYYVTSCENMESYYTDMGFTEKEKKQINVIYFEYWFGATRKWFQQYVKDSNNKTADTLIGIEL